MIPVPLPKFHCKLASCQRLFTRPPSAKGKEFCSDTCRSAWHSARRQAASALLASRPDLAAEIEAELAIPAQGEKP